MVDSLSLGLGAALGWAADVAQRPDAVAEDAAAPEPRFLS